MDFAIHPTIPTKPFLCSCCRTENILTYFRVMHWLMWFPPGKWNTTRLGGKKHQTLCRLRQTLFTVIILAQEHESAWALETVEKALRSPAVAQSMTMEAINYFQRVLSVLTPRYIWLLPICSTVYAELPWNSLILFNKLKYLTWIDLTPNQVVYFDFDNKNIWFSD